MAGTTSSANCVAARSPDRDALRQNTDKILQANAKDLQAAPGYGLTDAQTDRLKLDPSRIDGIALGMEDVAMLPDPIGEAHALRVSAINRASLAVFDDAGALRRMRRMRLCI